MRDNGYLTPEKNSVLVTVDNSDTAKAEALQQRIDTAMAKVMETADFDGAVISQVLQRTDEVTELARSLAISRARASSSRPSAPRAARASRSLQSSISAT